MLILALGDIHIPNRAIDFPNDFKKLLVPGKIQQVLCLGNVTNSISTLNFLNSLSSDLQIVKGAYDLDPKLPLSSVIQHDDLKIGFLNGYALVPKNDPLSLLVEARKMDVDILLWGGTHRVEAYTLDNKLFVNPGSATGAYTTEDLSDDDDDDDDDDEDDEDDDEDDEDDDEGESKDVRSSEHPDVSESTGTSANAPKTETKKTDQPAKTDTVNDNKETADSQAAKEDSAASVSDDKDLEPESVFEEPLSPVPSFCLLDVQGAVCTLYIYTYIFDEVKVDKVTYRKE